jgi:hypothetical protein
MEPAGLWGTVMADYRLYQPDKNGHIEGPPDGFICDSDQDVIEIAKRLIYRNDAELCQLDRLVIRLRSKDK